SPASGGRQPPVDRQEEQGADAPRSPALGEIAGFPSEMVLARNPLTGWLTLFVLPHSEDDCGRLFKRFLKTCGLYSPWGQRTAMQRLAHEIGHNDPERLFIAYLAWVVACRQFIEEPDTGSPHS